MFQSSLDGDVGPSRSVRVSLYITFPLGLLFSLVSSSIYWFRNRSSCRPFPTCPGHHLDGWAVQRWSGIAKLDESGISVDLKLEFWIGQQELVYVFGVQFSAACQTLSGFEFPLPISFWFHPSTKADLVEVFETDSHQNHHVVFLSLFRQMAQE